MSARSDDRFAVVFDTETTGLIDNSAVPLKSQPHIIELCAIKIDLNDVAFDVADDDWPGDRDKLLAASPMFSSLFHHGKLEEDTIRITGITQDLVDLAPAFPSKLRELQRFFLGAGALVGHNLSYDRDMLDIELRRMSMAQQFPWPPRHVCTVEVTEVIEGFRLGLNDLHERLFGIRFNEHHRAEPDTRATARCFMELIRRGSVKL